MHHNQEATESDLLQEQKRLVGHSPPPPTRPAKIPRTEERLPEEEEEGGVSDREGMRVVPGSQRYLVAVEYSGTRFFGAQKQPNCRTVVGVLEEAFQKFVGQPVSIFCSSRTHKTVYYREAFQMLVSNSVVLHLFIDS